MDFKKGKTEVNKRSRNPGVVGDGGGVVAPSKGTGRETETEGQFNRERMLCKKSTVGKDFESRGRGV